MELLGAPCTHPTRFNGAGDSKSAIDSFLDDLGRCDRSASTIRAYELGLRHFERWLTDQRLGIDAITRETISKPQESDAGGMGRVRTQLQPA